MRPLTAPALTAQYAFRCTTAGTAATEPAWPTNNNAAVTTGGATFTNVSGQTAYGWTAAAGSLISMVNGAGTPRPAVGDRVFLSSDHSESSAAGVIYYLNNATAAWGLIQFISVNRAGSVPPVAADALSGASIATTAGNQLQISPYSDGYWQGVTISSGANLVIASSGAAKRSYFRNCALVLSRNSGDAITGTAAFVVTLDATTIQFANATQQIVASSNSMELVWLNTPSAILGTVPTTLLNAAPSVGTFRGVDLSALTGTLMTPVAGAVGKLLLDSCRIASGLTRYGAPGTTTTSADEIELVNCFDGANIISERHTPAGDLTTNRTTTLTGGAQDDIGLFSHQLVSSARSDMLAMTLDSFWMDVENAFTGGSRTATVEIISSSTLNNTDIALQLEYLGTAGSSLATFASSLPNALTASAALPTSTAVWNGAPGLTLNPSDKEAHITLSNGNLTATGTAGWTSVVRATTPQTAGKFYWEYTMTTSTQPLTGVGIYTGSASLSTSPFGATGTCGVLWSGIVSVDGSNTITVGGVPGSSINLGSNVTNGTLVCVAVDLTAQLIWFRLGAGGNWNANAARNPATGTGGASIPNLGGAVAAFPVVATGGADVITVNFGATSYVGTPPSGFGNWPGSVAQRLQATFTPQQLGRLRGLVRLGKVSTTVYVNPQITVS